MLSTPDGPFINLARLNMGKYGARQNLAKALFEYIFHHENDVRNALDLASHATEACHYKDWWWKVQIGKCYYRLVFKLTLRPREAPFFSTIKRMNHNAPQQDCQCPKGLIWKFAI